jgi:uncharacterized YigZ family protein
MKIITETFKEEYVIEKSRFISILTPIDDPNTIKDYIKTLKVEYPKATHYCYAYIINGIAHSTDDGEPSGTAGVPILKVLQASGIDNAILVVIRYFGGIKLGAGGVLRAYSNSASLVIKNSQIKEKNHYSSYFCKIDYSLEQLFTNNIKKLGGDIVNKEYEEAVNIKFYIKNEKDLEELNTLFLGQLKFKYIGEEEIIS